MNRPIAMLGVLGLLLLLIAFYFLGWRPKSEQIEELGVQRDLVVAQTRELEQQAQELEQIRQTAPDIEAQIVAAESVIPRDLSLPSAVRQLQTAADEAGVELVAITPERPESLGSTETPGLVTIAVALQFDGGYFQTIDFLRRIEDPAITPRGFVWQTLSASPSEYPELNVNVAGAMFAVLPEPPAPPPEPGASPSPGTTPEPGVSPSPSPAALQEVGR